MCLVTGNVTMIHGNICSLPEAEARGSWSMTLDLMYQGLPREFARNHVTGPEQKLAGSVCRRWNFASDAVVSAVRASRMKCETCQSLEEGAPWDECRAGGGDHGRCGGNWEGLEGRTEAKDVSHRRDHGFEISGGGRNIHHEILESLGGASSTEVEPERSVDNGRRCFRAVVSRGRGGSSCQPQITRYLGKVGR